MIKFVNKCVKSRKKYNLKIAKLIIKTVKKHPELRFYQILKFLNIDNGQDNFYEEPETTFIRITNK